jgi:Mn-dependent DtxR family transcriptional regulator
MLLTNLRNAGYVDKKAYAVDRTVRLTAKGATKAEEVIQGLCGS